MKKINFIFLLLLGYFFINAQVQRTRLYLKFEHFNSSFGKTANYYTNYFTVAPVKSEAGITVKISLVDDSEMARRVVTRFFVSLEIKTINVNGTEVQLDEFIKTYIMK